MGQHYGRHSELFPELPGHRFRLAGEAEHPFRVVPAAEQDADRRQKFTQARNRLGGRPELRAVVDVERELPAARAPLKSVPDLPKWGPLWGDDVLARGRRRRGSAPVCHPHAPAVSGPRPSLGGSPARGHPGEGRGPLRGLLVGTRGLAIAGVDGAEVVPFALVTHNVSLLGLNGREGNISNGATICRSVTS